MTREIGERFEKPGVVAGRWRIPKFLSLTDEAGEEYTSSKFTFWGSCWCLVIYFGGDGSTEWMSVYLQRKDHGSPKYLSLSIRLCSESLSWEHSKTNTLTFSNKPESLGFHEFLTLSRLKEMKDKLDPSEEVVIYYQLTKCTVLQEEFSCRFVSRLWDVNQALAGICAKEKSDVKLKLKDGEIPAHKAVLKSRSPVFSRMFDSAMSESETGEVTMEDATVDDFRVFLSYVYSGDPKGLNPENAMQVYRLAHKYDIEDLRKLCTEVLLDAVTPDTVCDIFALADCFQEAPLKKRAIDCFADKTSEILEGENWKEFKRDNSQIAFELLESSLKLAKSPSQSVALEPGMFRMEEPMRTIPGMFGQPVEPIAVFGQPAEPIVVCRSRKS